MKTTWIEITEILRNTLDSGIFKVWIAPLKGEVDDKCIRITAKSAFMANWVRSHLLEQIQEAAGTVLGIPGRNINVEFSISKPENSSAAPAGQAAAQAQCRLEVPLRKPVSSIAWRYKFEDFVIGSSNNLAVAAARDMCTSGQVRTLFVTSAPGLGKTHLAQAAGELISHSGQPLRVLYITAEQFASRFVAAMRARELEDFKSQFSRADVLLFEDIHFLQRKKAMQEMALSIIKNLQDRGSRVIFTSSFAPRQLQEMDSQLTSHLCAGILANMDRPDQAMRREILRRKAKIYQVALPNDVCDFLSERLASDVRQLESCLKSMIFKAKLLNSGLTVDLAMSTAGEYAGAENSLDMAAIIRLVCESFGLTTMQLKSRSRKREYVQGRNTIFYLARKHTQMSLESIGTVLNRRHSTVMRSITQVEEELARESSEGRQIAQAVALIERKCGIHSNDARGRK